MKKKKFPRQKTLSLAISGGGGKFAIFRHSRQQKLYQGTLGTQRWTLIGSWTRLGHSLDPRWPYNRPNMALYQTLSFPNLLHDVHSFSGPACAANIIHGPSLFDLSRSCFGKVLIILSQIY